jgi:uncharacterized protein
MATISLSIVSCDGCSACCMQIGNPSPYGLFFLATTAEWLRYVRKTFPDDAARWDTLPEELWQELRIYYTTRGNQDDEGQPCIWLDQANRRCGCYDHRPNVCRKFEVGCNDCLAHRQGWEI